LRRPLPLRGSAYLMPVAWDHVRPWEIDWMVTSKRLWMAVTFARSYPLDCAEPVQLWMTSIFSDGPPIFLKGIDRCGAARS